MMSLQRRGKGLALGVLCTDLCSRCISIHRNNAVKCA